LKPKKGTDTKPKSSRKDPKSAKASKAEPHYENYVSTNVVYDSLDLNEWDDDEVKWGVGYASRSTVLQTENSRRRLESPQSMLENNMLDTSVAHHVTLKVPRSLFGVNSLLHVMVPKTVTEICVGGKCRPTLCRIYESFTPLNIADFTVIPSNIRLFFGDNKDCAILKPKGWDQWIASYYGYLDGIESESLYLNDPDGDGVSNIIEYYGLGMKQFFVDLFHSAVANHRQLVFVDFNGYFINEGKMLSTTEPYSSTNPLNPDTDGDLLADGYELMWGLNPNLKNEIGLDSDGDGLTDFQEQIYNTDPFSVDSDKDGISDYNEIQQGSDPLDNTDTEMSGGVVSVSMSVGDPSNSHSERYVMRVGNIVHQSPVFGEMKTDIYNFRTGEYKVTIKHLDTNEPDGIPDYDYEAAIDCVPTNGFACVVEDKQNLLGDHLQDDPKSPDTTHGKEAKLKIVETNPSDPCHVFQTCEDCHMGKNGCKWKDGTCREANFYEFDGKLEDCPCVKCASWVKERKDTELLQWTEDIQVPKCPCRVEIKESEYFFGNDPYWYFKPMDKDKTSWSYDEEAKDPNFNDAQYATHTGGSYGCLKSASVDLSRLVYDWKVNVYAMDKYKYRQHCCYNVNGELIPAGEEGSGTLELIEAWRYYNEFSVETYSGEDEKYFDLCCNQCHKEDICQSMVGGPGEIKGIRSDYRGCNDCLEKVSINLQAREDRPLEVDEKLMQLSYHAASTSAEVQTEVKPYLVKPIDGTCYGAFLGNLVDMSNFDRWFDSWFVPEIEIASAYCGSCYAKANYAHQFIEDNANFRLEMEECGKSHCLLEESCYVFTGFAEGGSIAEIAATMMADMDPILITFGHPPAVKKPCVYLESLRMYRYVNTIVEDGTRKHDPLPFMSSGDDFNFGHTIVIGDVASTNTAVASIPTPTYTDSFPNWKNDHTLSLDANDIYSYSEHLQQLTESKSFPIHTKWELGTLCSDNAECNSDNCARVKPEGSERKKQICIPEDWRKCLDDATDELFKSATLQTKIDAYMELGNNLLHLFDDSPINDGDEFDLAEAVCMHVVDSVERNPVPGFSTMFEFFDLISCIDDVMPYIGVGVGYKILTTTVGVNAMIVKENNQNSCVASVCHSLMAGIGGGIAVSIIAGIGVGPNVDAFGGPSMGWTFGLTVGKGLNLNAQYSETLKAVDISIEIGAQASLDFGEVTCQSFVIFNGVKLPQNTE
jgi:hypothetical protein